MNNLKAAFQNFSLNCVLCHVPAVVLGACMSAPAENSKPVNRAIRREETNATEREEDEEEYFGEQSEDRSDDNLSDLSGSSRELGNPRFAHQLQHREEHREEHRPEVVVPQIKTNTTVYKYGRPTWQQMHKSAKDIWNTDGNVQRMFGHFSDLTTKGLSGAFKYLMGWPKVLADANRIDSDRYGKHSQDRNEERAEGGFMAPFTQVFSRFY